MKVTIKHGWIVSLRAFAAMAVVMLHVVSGWAVEESWGGVTGLRWLLDGVLIQLLVRWSVPVFVLISGFLLLDPEKDMPLKKIRWYILRMTVVLMMFGYIYCLMESVATKGMADIPLQLLLSAKNLLEGKSWSHMWYVYMIIGLYLLTPMLRAFVKYADEKTKRWTLIMLFILTVVRPTVNKAVGMEISALIPISSPFIFYYLMGSYLHSHSLNRKISLFALCFGAGGVVLMQTMAGNGSVEMAPPENLFTALYAVGLFSMAKGNAVLERAAGNKLIAAVSKYSFGIYLIHPVFLNILNKGLHIYPDILPTGIGEAVFFIAALTGGNVVAWGLTKIRPIERIMK